MLRRWLLVALASFTLLALAGEVVTPPPIALAAPDQNFGQVCPGGGLGEQSFIIPAGVNRMTVTLNGAQGSNGFASTGGAGATAIATFNVTAGTQYYLDIGCGGTQPAGGWNGGGNAGNGTANEVAGGGGGATVLRSTPCASLPNPCPNVATDALLVAGGGGGGGGNGGPALGGFGGGHAAASPNGLPGGNSDGGVGGGGATPAAPGTATISNGSTAGDPGGVVGLGGTGSLGGVGGSGAGGGGGGGCHGGGGGSSVTESGGGGGGGGSSCAAASALNVIYAVHGAVDGSATIQFSSPPVLGKIFADASILSGGVTTMFITLDNDNPRPITNVSFTDNLAAAGIQVAAVPNFTQNCGVGTFNGFTAGSTLLTVTGVGLSDDGLPGDNCTISVDVTSTTLGTRTNTIAQVTSDETGPGPGDTASFNVVAPETIDLVATKTSSAAPQANVPFTWTVRVMNQGTGTAGFNSGDVIFRDNLPTTNIAYAPAVTVANQVGILGVITCSIAGADVNCIGTGVPFAIGPGGGFDVVITATATAPGAFTNPRAGGVCMADPDNRLVETNGNIQAEANNTCTNTVNISAAQAPDLTISKTHTGTFTPGQTGATFTITVSNAGTVATTGAVNVSDVLPAGFTATAISGTGWTCTLVPLGCTRADALAPAASYPAITLTVNVAAGATGTLTNTATVAGGNEPAANNGNNTATDAVTLGAATADLGLTKTGGTGTLLPGANVTYTLTLTNAGPAVATNVVLTDAIPANTTFVSATAAAGFNVNAPAVGAGPPAAVTFTTPTFAVGASATFTITVRVNPSAAASTVVNTATVTGAVLDANTANNTASVQGGLASPTPTPTPTATPSPFVPPVIPQVFQNPAVQGIFAPGNRATPTPVRPAGAVQPSTSGQPTQTFRPPSTGDAGLLRLRGIW